MAIGDYANFFLDSYVFAHKRAKFVQCVLKRIFGPYNFKEKKLRFTAVFETIPKMIWNGWFESACISSKFAFEHWDSTKILYSQRS